MSVKREVSNVLTAVQFLTRVPMPAMSYREDSLSGAVKYFPLVGALIGGAAGGLHYLLSPHLPRLGTAIVVLVFLVVATGALHEDGLADAVDGLGGGSNKAKILIILRDSRIGSYGATALCLSLVARLVLIASLPLTQVTEYLIVAGMLSRWTVLPLSYWLPPAREEDGQGARIARLTTLSSLIVGTGFSAVVMGVLMRWHAVAPMVAAIVVLWLSGRLYLHKIGGVTGDCFGATAQLAEVAILFFGVWV